MSKRIQSQIDDVENKRLVLEKAIADLERAKENERLARLALGNQTN